MAQYASQRKRPAQPKKSAQSAKASVVGWLVAFFGGYTLAWFYSPQTLTTWLDAHLGGGQQTPPPVQAKASELPKPKFEFYTLLTQEKAAPQQKAPLAMETPEAPKATPSKATPKPVVSTSAYQYVLQLASFQRREDAEEMKASLIMRGLEVSIQSVNQAGNAWYRVEMGPFASRVQAEKTQDAVLKSERIMGMIRRMDA